MARPQNVPAGIPSRRRVTAATLKQATARFLESALPSGWTSLPLAPSGRGQAAADLLVISPRGRCHFLLVRAPADRWWDGGPHSVPAEKLTGAEDGLLQRLRAGGHRARAIWGSRDLARALGAWGCSTGRRVTLEGEPASWRGRPTRPEARPGEARGKLHLAAWRSAADA